LAEHRQHLQSIHQAGAADHPLAESGAILRERRGKHEQARVYQLPSNVHAVPLLHDRLLHRRCARSLDQSGRQRRMDLSYYRCGYGHTPAGGHSISAPEVPGALPNRAKPRLAGPYADAHPADSPH